MDRSGETGRIYNQKSTQSSPHCPVKKTCNPPTETLREKKILQEPAKTPQDPPDPPKIPPRSSEDPPKFTKTPPRSPQIPQRSPQHKPQESSQKRPSEPTPENPACGTGQLKKPDKIGAPPPPPPPTRTRIPRLTGSLREVLNKAPLDGAFVISGQNHDATTS